MLLPIRRDHRVHGCSSSRSLGSRTVWRPTWAVVAGALTWLVSVPAWLPRPALPEPAGTAVVFDGVTVIDVEHGARLRDQRVVVVGTRIRALGSRRAVPLPRGARVVNARGQYLIPGLWDMHIHPSLGVEMLRADLTTPAGQAIVYHHVRAVYAQLIANGITGIRDAASWIPLDTFQIWKREIAAGQRVGPRLIISGKAIDDSLGCTRTPTGLEPVALLHTCVASADDARHLVDSLHRAGADMIKTYNLSTPTYFALAAEARRIGILFGGHVTIAPDTIAGLIASDSGATILDHRLWADVCGDSERDTVLSLTRCAAAAARLRRNHTWVTRVYGLWGSYLPAGGDSVRAFEERALRYGGLGGLALQDVDNDTLLARWRPLTTAERQRSPTGAAWTALAGDSMVRGRDCRAVRLQYAADVPTLLGPDVPLNPVGTSIHLMMLFQVLCGTPPLWSLQTATLNPARALRATDSLGTVAPGKLADLVLLEGDPLEDIWNVTKIAGVVANGRYFDRAALDGLQRTAVAEWRLRRAAWRQQEEKEAAEQRRAAPKQP